MNPEQRTTFYIFLYYNSGFVSIFVFAQKSSLYSGESSKMGHESQHIKKIELGYVKLLAYNSRFVTCIV